MRSELVVRFDYGSIVPWVRKGGIGLGAIAGPHALHVTSDIPLRGEGLTTIGQIRGGRGADPRDVAGVEPVAHACAGAAGPRGGAAGRRGALASVVGPVHLHGSVPRRGRAVPADAGGAHAQSTGAIVAAPTTSLPEAIGGVRNWDYRYCWVRDATFTLLSLIHNGFVDEAHAWREWLLRAVAGDPAKLQILSGSTASAEWTRWRSPGWRATGGPARAHRQRGPRRAARRVRRVPRLHVPVPAHGLEPEEYAWRLTRSLLEFLESRWEGPDEGIWEVRGPPRQFTHSKLMAWVAFDRGIRSIQELGATGPLERWSSLRDRIHAEVCSRAYDAEVGSFVQSYGSKCLDASVLMLPLVGFLPAADPRVQATVRAVEKRLLRDGLVRRYEEHPSVDGLPAGEGVFLPCSFWLADVRILSRQSEQARRLFERMLGLCNDVGLLSEEYDVTSRRLVGNFPQAFSHVSLVNTALNLWHAGGPAHTRSRSAASPHRPSRP